MDRWLRVRFSLLVGHPSSRASEPSRWGEGRQLRPLTVSPDSEHHPLSAQATLTIWLFWPNPQCDTLWRGFLGWGGGAAGTVLQDCRDLCRILAQKTLEERELVTPQTGSSDYFICGWAQRQEDKQNDP